MKAIKETWNRYSKKWFQKWGKRKLKQWQKKERKTFAEQLSSEAIILDAGSGTGRDTEVFTKFGLICVSLDFSRQMLLHASRRAKRICASMDCMPFRAEIFDGVWSCSSMKYLPEAELTRTLKEINRVLKPEAPFWIGLDKGKGTVTEKRAENVLLKLYLHDENHFGQLLEKMGFRVTEKQVIHDWRRFLNFAGKKHA